jgi:hypothetical protein
MLQIAERPRFLLPRLLAVLVLSVLSASCLVIATQPFYDPASIEFDEALVGKWESAEDRTLITVERGEWKSYKVTYPARSGPVVYTGYLTRVGESRVIDLTPAHSVDPASLQIPAHFAVRLQLLGDTLTATGFDYDWFFKESEQGRLPRLHPVLDGRKNVVLTADTAGLRAWFAVLPRGGDMFGDEIRFVRKP